jgi:DNA repair protein RecO (recombination protein O)
VRIAGEAAYVLHARPWRETSLLVEVLAEQQGRLGLIARGVQGPKRHVLRAALQPMQHIRLDAVLRGELAQLRSAEALDAAPVLQGDAALASFYINELVLRLAPRGDSPSGIVRRLWRSAHVTGERCTARVDAASLRTRPARCARIRPGARRPIPTACRSIRPRAIASIPNRARDAFGTIAGKPTATPPRRGPRVVGARRDVQPDADDLASLRRAMREVLSHHLGARGLKSWEMLAELGRLSKPR